MASAVGRTVGSVMVAGVRDAGCLVGQEVAADLIRAGHDRTVIDTVLGFDGT